MTTEIARTGTNDHSMTNEFSSRSGTLDPREPTILASMSKYVSSATGVDPSVDEARTRSMPIPSSSLSAEIPEDAEVEFDPEPVRGSRQRRALLGGGEGHQGCDRQAANALVLPQRSIEELRERAILWSQLSTDIDEYAESLFDMEIVRISLENRARAWARREGLPCFDKDGKFDPKLLPPGDPVTLFWDNVVKPVQKNENEITKGLEKAFVIHPLGPWVEEAWGVGKKQLGRALGALPNQNPFWRGDPTKPISEDNRPRRGPAELWAYCGFNPVPAAMLEDGSVVGRARSRVAGEHSNWNSQARMRFWLIAAKQNMMPKSPYRTVITEEKAKYEGAVHQVPCAQCSRCKNCNKPLERGPRDHREKHGCDDREPAYAQPGTALTKGHIQARAFRKVAKELLKDLFNEARDWHFGVERA